MTIRDRLAVLAFLVAIVLILGGAIVDGVTEYASSWSWVLRGIGYFFAAIGFGSAASQFLARRGR
jgi:hypothetical protein